MEQCSYGRVYALISSYTHNISKSIGIIAYIPLVSLYSYTKQTITKGIYAVFPSSPHTTVINR